MATLQVIEEKPAPPPKKYVLTLSEAEARALRILVGNVGGPDDGALRKCSNELWEAFRGMLPGVPCYHIGLVTPDDAANRYVATGK